MSSSLTAGTVATAGAEAEAASLTETAEGCPDLRRVEGAREGKR